jgi:hypothetical protein
VSLNEQGSLLHDSKPDHPCHCTLLTHLCSSSWSESGVKRHTRKHRSEQPRHSVCRARALLVVAWGEAAALRFRGRRRSDPILRVTCGSQPA